MNYEFEGRLKKVLPIITSGTFRKIEFILTSEEQYPQMIKFELQNAKIKLIEPFFIGDQIKVQFNIRGKEWISSDGKHVYFTNFLVWKLNKVMDGYIVPTKESPQQLPKYQLKFPPAEQVFENPREEKPNKWQADYQDLPF